MTPAAPTGTVTFLFTDIEGSTERWEQQRAAMAPALARHNAILSGAVDARGGTVFKTVGDAYCAVFPSASAALAAALDAQRALAAEDWAAFGTGFEALRVRMGLHTGHVELHDGDYYGPPLNRVARLMSAGHGGQILLSLATQQLVRDDLPAGCTLRDLGLHRLKDLRHSEHIFQVRAAGMPDIDTPPDTAEKLPDRGGPLADVDLLPAECPYRGLHAFREADARFFFGREVFTERLVAAVGGKPMVGVIGPSGSGKSSVVFAGLVPALRPGRGNGAGRHGYAQTAGNSQKAGHSRAAGPSRTAGYPQAVGYPQAAADGTGWTVLTVRPGAEPFHALAGVLVPLLEGELAETDRLIQSRKMAGALADGTLSVAHVLARVREKQDGSARLLLIADQFEELYTLCPDPKAQRAFQDLLFDAIHTAPDRGGTLKLALTLRADFMGHALAYRPFADAIQDHNVILGPMNHDELTRAIARPADLQGRAFESGLVERILGDVGEEAGSLPLLEFALTRLWERQESGWLTHAAYEAIGRVEGAVAQHADGVYDRLAAADRELARRVFVQLVRPGEGTEDTRRVATKDELGEAGWGLVRRLADARLVVTNRDEGGREVAEVVHEALIRTWGRLTGWMSEDRRFRMWQERLRFGLKQWEESGRDEGALLRGVPLGEAEGWLAERGGEMTDGERGFVAAGVGMETERLRRRTALERRARRLAWTVAVVAVVGLAGALLLARQANQSTLAAEREARRARAQRLAVQADNAIATDVELGALLALRAIEETLAADALVLPEAESVLHSAVQALHFDPIGALANTDAKGAWISGDGATLATLDADERFLRVWDTDTGTERWSVGPIARPERAVGIEVELSKNGRFVAIAADDLRVWEIGETQPRLTEAVPDHTFTWPRLSPDGRRIAVWLRGASDIWVIWDVESSQELLQLPDAESTSWTPHISPDGSRLAAGRDDGTIQLWDLVTGEEVAVLEGHDGRVVWVDYRPDGLSLASAGDDGTIRVWDSATGEETQVLRGHTSRVNDLVFDPAGRRLATASADGTGRLWDPSTGQLVHTLIGHTGAVDKIVFSHDGHLVATGSGDGTVKIWDTDTGAEQLTITGAAGFVSQLGFTPDGTRIVVKSLNHRLRLWNLEWDREATSVAVPVLSDTWTKQMALRPDANEIAVAPNAGDAGVWDLVAKTKVMTLAGHVGFVDAVVFSPDGRRLVTAGQDGTARLWDLDRSSVQRQFNHGSFINSAAFHPNGRQLLTVAEDGLAKIWDTETGRNVLTVKALAKGSVVFGAAFSPDGQRFATVGEDGLLHEWNSISGDELVALSGHEGSVFDCAYGPTGETIATGGMDGTVRVWNTRSGSQPAVLRGHAGLVSGVAFSADGTRLASSSWDGTARVWDLATGQSVSVFQSPKFLYDVLIRPDGKRLLILSGDGYIHELILPVDELMSLARSRLTRTLTPEECRQYLHVETCPADAAGPKAVASPTDEPH